MGLRKLARSFSNFWGLFWGRDPGLLAEDFKDFFDDKLVEENYVIIVSFSGWER